jgi:hypothetical protein
MIKLLAGATMPERLLVAPGEVITQERAAESGDGAGD